LKAASTADGADVTLIFCWLSTHDCFAASFGACLRLAKQSAYFLVQLH